MNNNADLRTSRRRVIHSLLLFGLFNVSSALAVPSPSPATPPPAPTEITATGKELILRAFENNADLRIEKLNVDRNQSNLLMQRSIFDPQLAADANMSDYVSIINEYDRSYNGPDPYGLRNDFVDTKSVRLELSQLLPTGGRVSLVGMENYLNNSAYEQRYNNGAYVYPFQETYTTRAFVMLSHPLLRNAGVDTTMTEIRVARIGNRIAGEQWKLSLCRTSASVYRKYIDLWTAQSSLRLTEQTIADLRTALPPGSPPEVVAELEKNIKPLADRIGALQGTIANLNRSLVHDLYRPPDWSSQLDRVRYVAVPPPETTEEPPKLDSSSLLHLVQISPEYRIATHILSQQQQRLDKNSNQTLPELNVYGRIGYIGLSGGVTDSVEDAGAIDNEEWEFGMRFTVSLGDKRERGLEESSQTEVTSAKYRLEKITYELQERLGGILQVRQSQYSSYCDVKQERQSLEAKAEIGPTKEPPAKPSPTEAVKFWQVRLRELDALALCEKTRLDWEVTTGQLLDRFGISVEE